MSTVVANSTRINDSNSNTNWGNYNKGGGAPASEGQNAYQGGSAVNGKINSTTDREGVKYTHTSTTDCTTAANALTLLKCTVADNSDLNTTYGLELAIGSADGQHYEYNVAGSGASNDWYLAYNSVGGTAAGYLFVAIDPTIAGWREATAGSPTLTAIDFWAVGAQFVSGQAKSENVALDAIDIGTGLTYSGSNFTFQDAVDADQDTVNNRWGWAASVGSAIFLRGMHVVNATGVDESIVFFPDGYHNTGQFGIECGAVTTFAGTYTGLGRNYSGIADTRPVFNDNGTATISGTLDDFREINLNANSVVTGTIEAVIITGAATYTNALIKTNKGTAGAAVVTGADISKMTNVTFEQAGIGHALEIDTPGTYNIDELRGLNASGGYGADGSNQAAIHNTSGGLVTLERLQGSTPTPTVRNGAGATTEVTDVQVSITITDIPAGLEGRFRQGAFTLVHDADIQTGSLSYAYPASEGQDRPITVSIGGVADSGTAYERNEIQLLLSSNSQTIPFNILINPSYI